MGPQRETGATDHRGPQAACTSGALEAPQGVRKGAQSQQLRMLSPEGAVSGRGWKQVSRGGKRSRAELGNHAGDAGKSLLSIYFFYRCIEHLLHSGDTDEATLDPCCRRSCILIR